MKKNIIYGCALLLLVISTGSHAQFIKNTGISLSNSTTLSTNGDWTNDAGSDITNHGVILTSDAFINNGTINASGNGGFILSNTSDVIFQPNASQMGFLIKKGSGNLLVTGAFSVRDSLFLNTGKLILQSNADTLTILPEALVMANAASFIDGNAARTGSGTFLFPIGKNSEYLPLTIHKLNASKATASVVVASGDYTAGPGVDALINFPYAWRVAGKMESDTAAYLEMNYANTLPVVADPIVVRAIAEKKYASMGARFIENASRVTVRSYSRCLNGLFSIARGFPVDFETDSLALIALYENTNGATWQGIANPWGTGDVSTWTGVEVNGQSITSISLPTKGITGEVPDQLTDIQSLQTVDLSGNNLAFIPDFSSHEEITSLNVSNNKLEFSSLEPNVNVPGFNFANQKNFGVADSTALPVSSAYKLNLKSGGASTSYQWKKDGQEIASANGPEYEITSLDRTTMGGYSLQVTNALFPGLVLESEIEKVLAYASISGTLYANATTPASSGKMTLFKVTDSKYDTIQNVMIDQSGEYLFNQVILDDYQILGFADTLVHERALPTYYENTTLWEAATVVALENNASGLDVVSEIEPGAPNGVGVISGIIEEEVDESSGRVKDKKKVGNAGVSVRKVENSGRGKEEILTLVSYVFSKEDGSFTITDLPVGEYQINVQYPGYPMDKTSDINLAIGNAWQSQVSVGIEVIDGQVVVRKNIVTGLYENENYKVEVFPNPATDAVKLNFVSKSSDRTFLLTDLNGRKLSMDYAIDTLVSIPVQHLERGIYIIRIQEKGKTVKTLKVSIE